MRLTFDLVRTFTFLLRLAEDMVRFVLLGSRSSAALKAENLFLRKQIALYVEREVKRRRADRATRVSLVLLSKLFAGGEALTIVKPEALIGWHRQGFRLLSRRIRPRNGQPTGSLKLFRGTRPLGTYCETAMARMGKSFVRPRSGWTSTKSSLRHSLLGKTLLSSD